MVNGQRCEYSGSSEDVASKLSCDDAEVLKAAVGRGRWNVIG